ncbi:hypothetical protein [Mesorhizobium sp. M0586]|uniref:hypothetical protein n=1 Tax=unclassified Mesorhizobium TaxID=325217 RepID=UPI003334D4A1
MICHERDGLQADEESASAPYRRFHLIEHRRPQAYPIFLAGNTVAFINCVPDGPINDVWRRTGSAWSTAAKASDTYKHVNIAISYGD